VVTGRLQRHQSPGWGRITSQSPGEVFQRTKSGGQPTLEDVNKVFAPLGEKDGREEVSQKNDADMIPQWTKQRFIAKEQEGRL